MTGIETLIVGLWLLPVTLNIILPLGILLVWLMGKLLSKFSRKPYGSRKVQHNITLQAGALGQSGA